MKIRWRLALFGTGVALVGMIIFAASLVTLIRRAAPNDQIALLGQMADETVTALQQLPGDRFPPPEPLITVDLASSSEPFTVVLDDSDTVLYATAALGTLPVAIDPNSIESATTRGDAVTVELNGIDVRIQARRWVRAGMEGVVVAGQSTVAVDEQLAGLRFIVWASATITILAAAVVSWLVSGRALRPLEQLAETTDAIGRTGDLGKRLPPVETKDELGVLTGSFNAMLEQLQRAQDRTEAALDTQKRFVADASHDLRSPLTTIRNNAGFLAERHDISPQDREEAIADIVAEAERMTRLVDRLLDLARSDLEPDSPRSIVDLVEVARNAVRRFQTRHAHPITLVASGPVPLTGNRDALTRLVEILLANAAQHAGGAIEVSAATRRDRAMLAVADRGPGVPPEHLDRLFERFFRVDPARSPSGSGLGLAIAERLVASHKGEIAAANRDGGGLIVTASFPLA